MSQNSTNTTDETNETQSSEEAQQISTLPPEVELNSVQKSVLGFVLAMTLFIVALEQTIATSSLPQITAALDSANGYTWIGTAYLLSSASVLPVYGKISDIYGRKPPILAAIGFFVVGSVLGGASVNMNMLIAARVIQGLGSGGIVGLVNVIISDMIPLAKRGLFIGIVGTTWLVASAIGPLVGGSLTEKGLWRWCFYINVPVGGLSFTLLLLLLKVFTPTITFTEGIRRIDFIGILLSISATCLLLIALDWGGTIYAWNSPIIVSFLVVSGVLYILFFLYESRFPKEPLVPPRLFLGRTRSSSLSASFCHAMSFMGIGYYLPFLFQSVYGKSPIIASSYIIPEAVLMGATSALGGYIISKTKRYVEMQRVGLAMTCVAIGILSTLNPQSNTARRVIYPALFGFPVGFNFQSFLISLQTRVERKDIAVATSMQAYIRQLGLSISIAVGGVAFQNKITDLARTSGNPTLEQLLSGNAPSSVNALKGLPAELQEVARSYYMDAFRVQFYVFVAIAGIGFIATLFIPQNDLILKKNSKDSKIEKLQQKDAEQEIESTNQSSSIKQENKSAI